MDSVLQKTFQEHLGVFLFALFLSVLTCFIAWYRSYFKISPLDSSKLKVTLKYVVGAFAIYFLVAMLISILIYSVLSTYPASEKETMLEQINAVRAWINLAVMGVVFISLLFYLKFIDKEVASVVIGEGSYKGLGQNIKNILMGAVSVLISFPLVIAMGQLANMLLILMGKTSQEQVAVRLLKSTSNNPVAYIFSALFVVLIIPIIEEILFRGFLQNWLAKRLGQIGAIFSCAFIFALFHFSMQQGWGNLEIIASLFVLASFAGFIYFRQKSIYASIGLHATFNGVNVLLMTLFGGS